jgi:hypothetical protein
LTRSILLVFLISSLGLAQLREPVPAFALQSDPETIFRGLRYKTPIPERDCDLFDIFECRPEHKDRIEDVSLRWTNLDDDPELEAILITKAKQEWAHFAAIFDKRKQWVLAGSFLCRRNCRLANFITTHKLTDDSPDLLVVHQDEGGSDGWILTHEAFHLRKGELWPVLRYTQRADGFFGASQEHLYAWQTTLVLHQMEYRKQTKRWSHSCVTKRWDARTFNFVDAPNQREAFCNAQTGKPIPEKSWLTTLPAWPLY